MKSRKSAVGSSPDNSGLAAQVMLLAELRRAIGSIVRIENANDGDDSGPLSKLLEAVDNALAALEGRGNRAGDVASGLERSLTELTKWRNIFEISYGYQREVAHAGMSTALERWIAAITVEIGEEGGEPEGVR